METSAYHKYRFVSNLLFPAQLGILNKEIVPPPTLRFLRTRRVLYLCEILKTRELRTYQPTVLLTRTCSSTYTVWVASISVPLKAYFGKNFKKKFYPDRVDQLSFDIYQRNTLFLLVYYHINFIGNQTKLKRVVPLK